MLAQQKEAQEVYESDNEERMKNVNHRGNENDEEWPCERIPTKKEPVEPMHIQELSITWSLRLSRDVPIDPLPMALPLTLTGSSKLVKTERTGPVASRLL